MSDINSSSLLTRVTGFFIKVGSQDLPFIYDPDASFGFDSDNSPAVFTASMSSLEDGFVDRININKPSTFKPNGLPTVNRLIVEGYENEAIKLQNTENESWRDVFTLLEFMFDNQTTIIQTPPNPGYVNYADEILQSEYINGVYNNFFVRRYVSGSMYINPSVKTGRIPTFTFRIIIEGSVVEFRIALDPDVFLSTYRTKSLVVWSFFDPNNDGKIDDNELQNYIVNAVSEITRQYNVRHNPETFIVPEYAPEGLNGEWIPKNNRMFFIFHNLDDGRLITVEMKKEATKKWLLIKFNGDLQLLILRFPTLFGNDRVTIIPVYNNKRVKGNNVTIVQPLDLITLRNVLTIFGFEYDINSASYRPTEVFTVGAAFNNPPTQNRTLFPIIAVDQSEVTTLSSFPITSRFPDFVAASFSVSGNEVTGSSADLLQFYIIRCILFHIGDLEYNALVTGLEHLAWESSLTGPRTYVSFSFFSTRWVVYGNFDL